MPAKEIKCLPKKKNASQRNKMLAEEKKCLPKK
jgi:hypothetical protein